METRNRGPVGDFGFFSADTNRIRLGELPAMPTVQFCGYATASILAAYSHANQEERAKMKGYVASAAASINRHSIRPTETVLDLPRYHLLQAEIIRDQFVRELNQAIKSDDQARKDRLTDELLIALDTARGEVTQDYSQNPFTVQGSEVSIGGTYVVDIVEFTAFATNYMAGGMFGWDSRGTPDYAYLALKTLKRKIR